MVKKMVVGMIGVAVMSLVLVTNLYADGKGCCCGKGGGRQRSGEQKIRRLPPIHKPLGIAKKGGWMPPGLAKKAKQDCDKGGDWKAKGFDKQTWKRHNKDDYNKDWKRDDYKNFGKRVADKKNHHDDDCCRDDEGGKGGMGNGGKGNGNTYHGNNGVGNGIDPQPPGNPPVNDGSGTGPGDPGNKGGANNSNPNSDGLGNSNSGGNSSNHSNNGNHNGK